MKKVLFLVSILILFSFNLFSIDYSFSIEPILGVKKAKTTEAFYHSGNDSDKQCSRLEWREAYVLNGGLSSECKIIKPEYNYIFNTLFTFDIPYNKGKMTDKDWYPDGSLTTSSEFDCKIDLGFNIETSFGFEYKFNSVFSLIPAVKIQYEYNSFNGRNGHGWYYLTTDSPHYYPDGKYHLAGIDYKTHKTAFFTGLYAKTTLSSLLFLEFGLDISPFTLVLAKDRHLARNYVLKSYIYSCLKNYNVFANASYKLNKNLFLKLNVLFNYFNLTKGKDYYDWDEDDRDSLSAQDGGYGYWKINSSLGLKVILQ
jgi:hypothetical protein